MTFDPTSADLEASKALFGALGTRAEVDRFAAEVLGGYACQAATAAKAGDQIMLAAALRRAVAAAMAHAATTASYDTPPDDICRGCGHVDVSHGPDGCMVVGCSCRETDVTLGITEMDTARPDDPLSEGGVWCGTCHLSALLGANAGGCTCGQPITTSLPVVEMPIPVVHVAADGTRTCTCGHTDRAHAGAGCMDPGCDCEWTKKGLATAKEIPASVDGAGQ